MIYLPSRSAERIIESNTKAANTAFGVALDLIQFYTRLHFGLLQAGTTTGKELCGLQMKEQFGDNVIDLASRRGRK